MDGEGFKALENKKAPSLVDARNDAVLDAANQAAGYLHQGQMFFDVNSASPVTKKTAAGLINAAHAKYVEGAVMAPVPGPGISVPILAGGPAAEEAAGILNALGMNVTPVTTEIGRAHV